MNYFQEKNKGESSNRAEVNKSIPLYSNPSIGLPDKIAGITLETSFTKFLGQNTINSEMRESFNGGVGWDPMIESSNNNRLVEMLKKNSNEGDDVIKSAISGYYALQEEKALLRASLGQDNQQQKQRPNSQRTDTISELMKRPVSSRLNLYQDLLKDKP